MVVRLGMFLDASVKLELELGYQTAATWVERMLLYDCPTQQSALDARLDLMK